MPLGKELNDVAKQILNEISTELSAGYGFDERTSQEIIREVLLREIDDSDGGGCVVNGQCTVIVVTATDGNNKSPQVLVKNIAVDEINVNGEQGVQVIDGSNLAIKIFDKSAAVSYKIEEAIEKSGVNPQAVGLALSLAFGGPVGLVKDLVKDAAFGEEIEKVENAVKDGVTAVVRDSDRGTISAITSEAVKQQGDISTQQVSEQVQRTKDGVGFLASVVGVGGSIVGGKIVYDKHQANKQVEAERQQQIVENNHNRDDFQQYDHYRKDNAKDREGKPVAGGDWDWEKHAPNGGAVAGTRIERTTQVGETLDRFGPERGRYLSNSDASLEQRALPPGTNTPDSYHQYKVLKPFDIVEEEISPAFGQSGGGKQILSKENKNVQWLLENKYIEEIK